MAINPSILSHVSVGTNKYDEALAFYQKTLATMGMKIIMQHPDATAFGREYPEFWIQTPIDGKPATIGNGTHIGFFANSKQEVDAFWNAALENGASPDGKPGSREEYGKPYYGCFVRDLDGHKIEAAFWNENLQD